MFCPGGLQTNFQDRPVVVGPFRYFTHFTRVKRLRRHTRHTVPVTSGGPVGRQSR